MLIKLAGWALAPVTAVLDICRKRRQRRAACSRVAGTSQEMHCLANSMEKCCQRESLPPLMRTAFTSAWHLDSLHFCYGSHLIAIRKCRQLRVRSKWRHAFVVRRRHEREHCRISFGRIWSRHSRLQFIDPVPRTLRSYQRCRRVSPQIWLACLRQFTNLERDSSEAIHWLHWKSKLFRDR